MNFLLGVILLLGVACCCQGFLLPNNRALQFLHPTTSPTTTTATTSTHYNNNYDKLRPTFKTAPLSSKSPGGGGESSSSSSSSSGNKNEREESSGKTGTSNPSSIFESMVHQVTGDTNYKFGDLTKKTMSDLTGKNIEQEGYQFGDISKNLASKAGQTVTGDATYEFGDITRSKLVELEQELDDWKSENINNLIEDLPNSVFQNTFKNLNPKQRRELIIGLLRLGAIGVLTWGFVANICTSGVLSLAWVRTSLLLQTTTTAAAVTKGAVVVVAGGARLPLLPFAAEPAVWKSFMATYSTLQVYLEPFLLIVKACGTLGLFRSYVKCIVTIEQKCMSKRVRKEYPLIFRGLSLVTAFLLNNLILSAMTACVWMGAGGAGVRLLRFWLPIL